MKTKRNFPFCVVTPKCEKFIKNGHVWVYGEEILETIGTVKNGDLIDVVTKKGNYLGTGFYNDNSKITVRILSKNANDKYDSAFFERRINYALDYRMTVLGEDVSSCRLIFGEADGFPGLTVDKFEDIIVTQTLSLGIEQRKDIIFPLIIKVLCERGFNVRAIYERNDVSIREKEGLEQNKGYYYIDAEQEAPDGHVIISENNVKYDVDYIEGQKTGFFLDQRYNRLACSKIAKGKNVLDCFTHTGAFALNCALGGAKSVNAVDISALAIEQTKKNAELNGIADRMTFTCDNVFELLTKLSESKEKPYDFIILDPPAFTKSSATVKNAYRGYKEINLKAMKLLPRGGYLATCSCSHFMKNELFVKMLHEAAHDAGVSLIQIEIKTQGPDHPILWNVPETDYLKFYIFQVI